MSGKIDITKWIVAALLILHVGWIGNHMRWVASGQINPWKLGGYGMYTIPQSNPAPQVYDALFRNAPLSVNWIGYDRATRFMNPFRTFRCADVPAAALLAFFDDNRDLIGKDLAFVYTEQQFVHNPPSTKRVMQGEVDVTWQDTQTFTYTNRFCGNEHVATATSPFEFATLP
jgi:hypothetical protein